MIFPLTELIGIFACLVFSAFFSASETALTSLGRARIDRLTNENQEHATTLQLWLDTPRVVLTTILIGNHVGNTLVAALATTAAANLLRGRTGAFPGLQAIPIAVGVMTFL